MDEALATLRAEFGEEAFAIQKHAVQNLMAGFEASANAQADAAGSSRARDPQADKNNLWRAFLKRDFATEPQPTYPKTNPTDPGRPGFAPTAKKSEEGPKRSPRQCSSARPEARARQQAARHAARRHHHRRRDAAEPARVAPRTHGRAHLPNDAQPRPERKPERKPGAEAAERPRNTNNKRTTMARHPELRDLAPTRPKIRL